MIAGHTCRTYDDASTDVEPALFFLQSSIARLLSFKREKPLQQQGTQPCSTARETRQVGCSLIYAYIYMIWYDIT